MKAQIFLLLTITLSISYCQQSASLSNLEELIGQIFTDDPINVETSKTTTTISPKTGGLSQIPQTTGCPLGSSCVPYYLCNNSMIVRDGAGIIDIRFDGESPRECSDYLTSCCKNQETTINPVTKPEPTIDGCGFRNTDGVGFRITGNKDNETEYGEFPWMVAILKEEITPEELLIVYQCGGSLIHPSIVLTAAHCVKTKSPKELKVRAGEWDTQTKTELYPHQDRKVIQLMIHPEYNSGGLFNDIALIFLDKPFEFSPVIEPICLPPRNFDFNNARCFATGWGKDVFGSEGKYQVIMKKIDLPIVSHNECQARLRETRLSKYFQLHNSFICAGGEAGKDTCKGDGGSPLVCPIPGTRNRFYQAGIVAWGIGCGDPIPGVYASVSKLREWIDISLQREHYELKYYTP